jgi:isocitrate/isopropylmalate dehydrogenase
MACAALAGVTKGTLSNPLSKKNQHAAVLSIYWQQCCTVLPLLHLCRRVPKAQLDHPEMRSNSTQTFSVQMRKDMLHVETVLLFLHLQVCLKGTLFTPLSKKNTSTQSLNVQMRKDLELTVNLVHGFTLPGVPVRHEDLDIVVIR